MLRNSLRNNYNAKIVNQCANDPKKMWKHINETLYNKKVQKTGINAVKNEEGNVTTNKKQIANIFNGYFCNVGKELHDKLNPSNFTPSFLIRNHAITRSMFLWNVNEEEIIQKILTLKKSKSINDIISSHSLKHIATPMAPLLCKWINESFSNGVFPNELKCSRIVPIHKDGNPLIVSNYRPISVLSCLSKVEESILYDRINTFLSKNNIINENQFGFQKNSGALSAASTLVDLLQTNLDANKNSIACCVFIDLKKAFDTVPHIRLLSKMSDYGLRGNVNKLIASYLNTRPQFVDVNDTFSDTITNPNEFGLPQGSNLGPLFFLIYINGIFDLKLHGILILYADDAVLVLFDTCVNSLRNKVQSDLNTIASWLAFNKLTLNSDKTKYMLVKPFYSQIQTTNFHLTIDNAQMERVSTFKYLGLIIREDLKWDNHIDSICNKLAGFTGAARRFGRNLSVDTKISLYYSMCNSYLSYLSPVWSPSITQQQIYRLQVAQNNAIRVIFSFEYNILNLSTAEIYAKYNILDIKKLIPYYEAIMIYKMDKNLMKCSHNIDRNSAHDYDTRSRSLPRLQPFRTNMGKNSIFRTCTERYRELPPGLHRLQSLHLFKKHLKNHIVNQNTV